MNPGEHFSVALAAFVIALAVTVIALNLLMLNIAISDMRARLFGPRRKDRTDG